MSTIVTRTSKGSPLSWAEADANLTNLNTDKLEASALTPYLTSSTAASTYETQTHASSTYETQTHASSTYPTKANNLSDLASASTARTNLGLGTAATQASTAFAASGLATASGLTSGTGKLIGRSTAATGALEEIAIGTGLTLTSGTLSASSVSASQIAKAWCNFDGTQTGTITPRASYNVSSVTKNGTGDYTINFTSAMSSANYATLATSSGDITGGGNFVGMALYNASPSTSSVRTVITALGGTVNTHGDSAYCNVVVFGN